MQIQGISQIHGAHHVKPSQQFHQKVQQQPPASSAPGGDELQISPEADLISRLREVPQVREERIAEIRAQIKAGTYETPEKLDVALERLLDEIG